MSKKTFFVDLDGTLVYHNHSPEIVDDIFIPGSLEKVREWVSAGHKVIITTGRTQKEGAQVIHCFPPGVSFLWDCGTGPRVLINDHKPGDDPKAGAWAVYRDEGIGGLPI